MTHRPMDPLILDQMYEHPERFTHLGKDEYVRILIEDIRHWRRMAASFEGALSATMLNADLFGTAYLQVNKVETGYELIPLPPASVTVSVQP